MKQQTIIESVLKTFCEGFQLIRDEIAACYHHLTRH